VSLLLGFSMPYSTHSQSSNVRWVCCWREVIARRRRTRLSQVAGRSQANLWSDPVPAIFRGREEVCRDRPVPERASHECARSAAEGPLADRRHASRPFWRSAAVSQAQRLARLERSPAGGHSRRRAAMRTSRGVPLRQPCRSCADQARALSPSRAIRSASAKAEGQIS
jgi:hypothetical protein